MNQFGDILFFLSKSLKAYTESMMKTKEIGIGQLQILMVLYAEERAGLTQKGLVEQLKVDKGNVSRNLSKLNEKGYLEYHTNSNGVSKISLSADGKAAVNDLIPVLMEIDTHLKTGIDIQDIQNAIKTMNQMILNLEVKV